MLSNISHSRFFSPMRTPRPSLLALLIALAALGVPGWAWAVPAPEGLYRADPLGPLLLRSEGDRVSGHAAGGGACGFEEKRRVLEGQFQGNVLVGSVLLCQTGAACPAERSYPLLAFYNPADHTLSARVRLEPGCQSQALGPGGALLLVAAGPGAGAQDAARAKGPTGTANPRAAAAAFEEGQRLLAARDYAGAAQHFQVGISYDERNWAAYQLLGVAEFFRGRIPAALAAYEHSAELNPKEPTTFFNLACAHSRLKDRASAMRELRRAVALGFALPEEMRQDADLHRLLGSDPEFKALVKRAAEHQAAAERAAAGKGR
jgi:tetratricopeptide (TPR) repeat protein